MTKFEEAVEKAKGQMSDLGVSPDNDLLTKVAKGLGPALYNIDASLVSTSSKTELETVRKNFVMNKLGVTDEAEAQRAMDAVAEKMSSAKRKQRINFYYLLVKELGKESVYA